MGWTIHCFVASGWIKNYHNISFVDNFYPFTHPHSKHVLEILLFAITNLQSLHTYQPWIHLVCLCACTSVCLSVVRWHIFRSATHVYYGILISYPCCYWLWADVDRFSGMSLSKWPRGSPIGLPDSNFTLVLNIKSNLHCHLYCAYGKKSLGLQQCHSLNGCLASILDFSLLWLRRWYGFEDLSQVCLGI